MNNILKKRNSFSIFERASYANRQKVKNELREDSLMELKIHNYTAHRKQDLWEKIKEIFLDS